MREIEVIDAVAGRFARSPLQRNARFTSDAEIVELPGGRLAITVDDYSAEDRLPSQDAALLGWNLVTATVSDLLAVGAEPCFMLNSLVTTAAMDAAYLRALAGGMQEALTACGACMLGGDVGTAVAWRFTGVALGTFAPGRTPLSRLAPCEVGAVMVTGDFGDANLAAGVAGPAPRFEMRLAESAALASIAPGRAGAAPGACIDTSDGLVSALETLCALDAQLRIEVDLRDVPYAGGVVRAAAALDVPPEVFLMGSAGEYELLALIPEHGRAAAEQAGLRRIGTFRRGARPGLHFRARAGRPAAFAPPVEPRDPDRTRDTPALTPGRRHLIAHPGLPDPRDAATFDAYRARLIALARQLFGAGRRGGCSSPR